MQRTHISWIYALLEFTSLLAALRPGQQNDPLKTIEEFFRTLSQSNHDYLEIRPIIGQYAIQDISKLFPLLHPPYILNDVVKIVVVGRKLAKKSLRF